jgi:hypothetical protein
VFLRAAIGFGLLWTFIVAILIWTQRMFPLFHHVPDGIRYACIGLVLIVLVLTLFMLRQRAAAAGEITALRRMISSLSVMGAEDRRAGREMSDIDRLRRKANILGGHPAVWWSAIDDSLVLYGRGDGDDGWFLDRRADEILPIDDVIAASYHQSFHQTVPAIVTSLGLLTTFAAILIALAGVSYNPQASGAPVRGIDSLINGLAGKFLSSILALLLSVSFTLIEKLACERGLQHEYESLVEAIRVRFPILRPVQILADMSAALRSDGRRLEGGVRDEAPAN